jgi:hypothetical protein
MGFEMSNGRSILEQPVAVDCQLIFQTRNRMNLRLNFLLLAVFAFSYSFAQTGLEDLHIDTSITGFHFAADFQGTKVFTKNGPSDIQTVNPTAFSFTIAPNVTAAMAKDQLDQLLSLSEQYGFAITGLIKKDTTIKGNSGYYISYTETDDKTSYKNFVFNAFVMKGNTLILFTSGDLDSGRYMDKFKKTFYSIKL